MPFPQPRFNKPLALACLILLVGFGLRAYRLGASDIWWDEGWGVVLSRLPLAESLQRTASDEHPPLYYWSLHFWRLISGDSPFGARLLSVFAGTLTVAVLFSVGRRLGGARLGALAALLLAFSRFHIQWSQEIKMYTLAALFGLLSFWFLANWRPNWRSALSYGLCALGAIYSHYIALLLIFAQGLGGLLWGIGLARRGGPHRWCWLAAWLATQAGLISLLIPWGLYLLKAPHPQFTAPPPIEPGIYLQVVTAILTLGLSTHVETLRLRVLFLLILGAAALPQLWARPPVRRLASRQMLLNLVIPPALIYALSLTKAAELFAPKFDSRYLLIFAPFAFLGLGWGLKQWARQRALGLILVGGTMLIHINLLPGYYAGRHPTADLPALMKTLTNLARPSDGVLLYTDKDWPVFEYYNHQRTMWVGLPSQANLSSEEVASRVDPLASTHTAVWVVRTPDAITLDPQGAILTRLAETHPLAADLPFGRYRLQLFTAEQRPTDQLAASPEPQVRLRRDVYLLAPLKLIGYDLPVREVAAGDYFPVSIYLENPPSSPTAEISLQLRDARGTVLRETKRPLSPGADFVTEALPISASWAGGRYQLRLAIRRADASGTDEFALDLASITVRPVNATGSPPEPLVNPRQDNFGDLIRLEGSSTLPARAKPGSQVPITLYWRAQKEMVVNYTVFVHLLGEELNPQTGNFIWGQVDREPQEGRSPTSSWVAGQLTVDAYSIQLSPDAPPGDYQVEVGLYDHSTGERLRVGETDAVVIGIIHVP